MPKSRPRHRTVTEANVSIPMRRIFLPELEFGLGYTTIPKRKPYSAPPRWPRISEPLAIKIIMTSMKMHMPVKQHLICSSCGLPLKALQLTMIMTS